MATGKKAFEGKSSASVMAKILETDPPPISSLQPMTPPALDRVVKRCLAKEPDERWQSANDLANELKWIAEGGSQATLASAATAKSIRALSRQSLIFGLCALLLGLAIGGLAIWNLKSTLATQARPVTRSVIALPPGERLAGFEQPAIVISPDGSHLACVAIQGSTQQLYLRAMDSLEAKTIPGTEAAVNPFFSPDSSGGQDTRVV
jgi:serine/threonine protein kinase